MGVWMFGAPSFTADIHSAKTNLALSSSLPSVLKSQTLSQTKTVRRSRPESEAYGRSILSWDLYQKKTFYCSFNPWMPVARWHPSEWFRGWVMLGLQAVKVLLCSTMLILTGKGMFFFVVVVERVRNKSNPGSTWDSNQDLLNTSQTHLALSHLDPGKKWKTSYTSSNARRLIQTPTDLLVSLAFPLRRPGSPL